MTCTHLRDLTRFIENNVQSGDNALTILAKLRRLEDEWREETLSPAKEGPC